MPNLSKQSNPDSSVLKFVESTERSIILCLESYGKEDRVRLDVFRFSSAASFAVDDDARGLVEESFCEGETLGIKGLSTTEG